MSPLELALAASAALDAYHATLRDAALEVGTGKTSARILLRSDRTAAASALLALAGALSGPARNEVCEMAAGILAGYSLPTWGIRVMRLATDAMAEARANVRAALPAGETCTDDEADDFLAGRGAKLGDEPPWPDETTTKGASPRSETT